jgi:hypothetical protein
VCNEEWRLRLSVAKQVRQRRGRDGFSHEPETGRDGGGKGGAILVGEDDNPKARFSRAWPGDGWRSRR